MNDSDLIALGVDAAKDLKLLNKDVSSIAKDVSAIRDLLSNDSLEVSLPDGYELPIVPQPVDQVAEVSQAYPVPDGFYGDLLSFQWCQTVLLIFVLAALMLNFGVNLWLAFSDKWRS